MREQNNNSDTSIIEFVSYIPPNVPRTSPHIYWAGRVKDIYFDVKISSESSNTFSYSISINERRSNMAAINNHTPNIKDGKANSRKRAQNAVAQIFENRWGKKVRFSHTNSVKGYPF
jgi:hypothetical protein